MTRSIRCAALGGLWLLLASVASVAAHADLVESDPADGETIEMPYTLTATFNEPLVSDRSRIVITELGDPTELARGGIADQDATVMTVDLELSSGEYVARWTAVTEDGGVTRGSFDFNVRATGASPANTDARFTHLPTTAPNPAQTTSSVTLSPTAAPTPGLSATPSDDTGQPTADGDDLLLALALAGIAIGALAFFMLARRRR